MNKREFRLWKRRLRAEARRLQLEQARDPRRGSYNETSVDPGTRWTNYNQESILRYPKVGDKHTTTSYGVEVRKRHGNNVARFTWYNTLAKTSGSTAVGCTPEGSTWWGGYSFSSDKRSALLTAAQAALVAKVGSGIAQWDLLTDLAEGKETIRTLKSASSWFYELARIVRTRDARAVFQHMNILPTRRKIRRYNREIRVHYSYALGKTLVDVNSTMANLWMSYRYGFMPMIYSMRDAFAVFTSNPDLSSLTKKFQVTLKEHIFYKPEYKQADNGSGLLYTLSKTYSATGSIRHQAYVSFTGSVKARLGLTSPSSLLVTTWELVPWSWVIDWFVNIGSYLQGLRLENLVPGTAVNSTEKGDTTISASFSYSSKDGWRHKPTAYLMGGRSQCFYFKRWKGNLSSSFVGWDPWFNFKRSLDTACLSWQRTKKYIRS